MPVRRKTYKSKQTKTQKYKMTKEIKLYKLAIGDWFAKDKDGTKYFVNVTEEDGYKYIRIRVDMGDDKVEYLLKPEFAIELANAIFRAAFNAKVLTVEEIREAWQVLRNQFKQTKTTKSSAKNTWSEENEEDIDVSFQ